ncbi:hypothetical protein [Brevundimonas sp.]|uniref:hypothetical protein n=1 Tax=Brevundimonas sp. TaxID=1871086 RepID=UPI00289F2A76|nr:hypothetical protein [Brevundimonas sp.]
MFTEYVIDQNAPRTPITTGHDLQNAQLRVGNYFISGEHYELAALLSETEPHEILSAKPCEHTDAAFWEVYFKGNLILRACTLPKDTISNGSVTLPTSSEEILLKFLRRTSPEEYNIIKNNNSIIFSVETREPIELDSIFTLLSRANSNCHIGSNVSEIYLEDNFFEFGFSNTVKILSYAHLCRPIKYAFIEHYRCLEHRFLYEILNKFNSSFINAPHTTLSELTKDLASEMAQFGALQNIDTPLIEAFYDQVTLSKTTNSFASAIFRKINQNAQQLNSKKLKGFAAIYYIRCAVVHAGEKDIIFESYQDAEDLLADLLPELSKIALSMSGLRTL